jgi:hypothetical protein
MVFPTECHPSPSTKARWILVRDIDSVGKIRIRNICGTTEVPTSFGKSMLIPSNFRMMLGGMFKPIVPLSFGAKKLEIEIYFDNTENIELIFFDTLMYLVVLVVLWIHRKSLNIAERDARMIYRTRFKRTLPAIRHPARGVGPRLLFVLV